MTDNGTRTLDDRVEALEDNAITVVAVLDDQRRDWRLVNASVEACRLAVTALTNGHSDLARSFEKARTGGDDALKSLAGEVRDLRASVEAAVVAVVAQKEVNRTSQMQLEAQSAALALAQQSLASQLREASQEGAADGARRGTQKSTAALGFSLAGIIGVVGKALIDTYL